MHLREIFQVEDQKTIRKQHLGYLRTKGLIEVESQPGKDNIWHVVNRPSIIDYVFSTFQGDELVELYRASFFQSNLVNWYLKTLDSSEPSEELKPIVERIEELCVPDSDEEASYIEKVLDLGLEALLVSPSRWGKAIRPASTEGDVIRSLLMSAGRGSDEEGYITIPRAEMAMGEVIAHLMVSFFQYQSLQKPILAFVKRADFLQLFEVCFPRAVMSMVFRSLLFRHYGTNNESFEDIARLYDTVLPDPLIIPETAAEWEAGMRKA